MQRARFLSCRPFVAVAAGTVALVLGAAVPPAWAGAAESPQVRTLATFDHAIGQTPENLVVRDGVVIVSLAFASTVVVVDRAGRTVQSLTLPTRGGFIAGLALDPGRRAVAVSVSSPDGDVAGVWSLPLRGRGTGQRLGSPARLAALPGGGFPNGVTRSASGDLYVADSLAATIWRVPAGAVPGAPAQAWLVDPALAPGTPGLPGANGVKIHGGRLYVSNTGRSTLLSVPLAGPRALGLVRADLRIDDFAFDDRGVLYAALNQGNAVVRTRATAGAAVTVLADAGDGLHNPSAVAFGDDRSADGGLYVTNAAFDGPTPPPSLQLVAGIEDRP